MGVSVGAAVAAGGAAAGEVSCEAFPIGEASVVADVLRGLGYENACDRPPAPWACAEPIVCSLGRWSRDAAFPDATARGARDVDVICCMEDARDAEVTARAVAQDLAGFDWSGAACPDGMRVVAADVAGPERLGRDSSGRWLWGVRVRLTVALGVSRDA